MPITRIVYQVRERQGGRCSSTEELAVGPSALEQSEGLQIARQWSQGKELGVERLAVVHWSDTTRNAQGYFPRQVVSFMYEGRHTLPRIMGEPQPTPEGYTLRDLGGKFPELVPVETVERVNDGQ